MARYAKPFAHIGRMKRAASQRRRRHALACLALVRRWRTPTEEVTP